jgi:hypothetical protein
MSVSDCRECLDLIEHAGLTIRRHLSATAAITLAVQKSESAEVVSALEEAARVCSLDRENAVARYESHLAQHGPKAMAADSDSAGS